MFSLNACAELYSPIASLLSCMLTHGIAPGDLFINTVTPIPKVRNANSTNSDYYGGTALSEKLGKLFDLNVLASYGDIL